MMVGKKELSGISWWPSVPLNVVGWKKVEHKPISVPEMEVSKEVFSPKEAREEQATAKPKPVAEPSGDPDDDERHPRPQ